MNLPQMATIQQIGRDLKLPYVAEAASQSLAKSDWFMSLKPGQRIGVATGSRGIDRLDEVIRSVINTLLSAGVDVVLIPAMGSHGGGTAHGQAALVTRLTGVEDVQIDSRMETAVVGRFSTGHHIHASIAACEVDQLVLVNRVRPHTMFTGAIESGLCKMLTVGLGKAAGAEQFHSAVRESQFESLIRESAAMLSSSYPLAGGLALVENSNGELATSEWVPADNLLSREVELMKLARDLLPRLPFEDYDLLIIDEIGKDISGTGMDTGVIGRKGPEDSWIGKVLVLGLTETTAGNAYGLGYADMTTQRVADAIDAQIAAVNQRASGNPIACRMPSVSASPMHAVETLLKPVSGAARIVRIQNTKKLRTVQVSEAYARGLGTRPDLQPLSPWGPLNFEEPWVISP